MTQAGGQTHIGKDRGWLWPFVLLALFVLVALYSEQAGQDVVTQTAPSSLNNRPQGAKALYQLFGTLPYSVRRLSTPWTTLTPQDGLIIVIEKFDADRQPKTEEISALANWTREGGTVLYIAQEPARPMDDNNPLTSDIAIIEGQDTPHTVTPAVATPLTRQVGSISVSSKVRLRAAPASRWQTLFSDRYGAIAARKRLGQGHIIVAADPLLVSNQGVTQADNVVLLANIAQDAVGQSGLGIVFDEYHHGVGFEAISEEQETWISALPLPIKRAALPVVLLLLLIIYNGNQRFGAARTPPLPASRASGEYVQSLARWYRRAEAADIVAETLYNDLLRHVARHLELPPDTPAPDVQQRLERVRPADGPVFAQITDASRQIIKARRADAPELLTLVVRMERFKRALQNTGK